MRQTGGGSSGWRIAGGMAALALVAAVPLSGAMADDAALTPGPDMAAELAAAGVTSAERGALSGRRMVAGEKVTMLEKAPERAFRELVARVGEDGGLEASLRRAGVPRGDAEVAAQAIEASADMTIAAGTRVDIRLGAKAGGGVRPLEALKLRARDDLSISLTREAGNFIIRREAIGVEVTPQRLSGRVGDGLYWALRGAGVTPRAAQDYLKAISSAIDVGEVGPADRFDLVIERRSSADGNASAGRLLYAGLERSRGEDVALMHWQVGGEARWLDAARLEPQAEGMIWPVAARISSGFGMRRHPILRYKRMHKGIDFAAPHGTPVQAAADGVVIRSGRAGGAGNQVRIRHADGTVTSYSHMSRLSVAVGTQVRQGDVVGAVGSTGLSTGPHLHYEVHQGGRAVDPRSVELVARAPLGGEAMDAFKARYAEYQALPVG
ncbi:M23 family metallopeptidase [Sphingomicrobium aestuariivivum]|uniref:M23 family metallopeptidase n=1 Tax=Sphingomicrobium aestuariivivum TaxID=1582356 RepID=UPI001FD66DC6|nr:M23 family metallopeptidase [Sphingomicrobium aestuariivivum]MCJ8191055.1 M23 family metallopeptidase [Sphingomicrobium aestuariivivum]